MSPCDIHFLGLHGLRVSLAFLKANKHLSLLQDDLVFYFTNIQFFILNLQYSGVTVCVCVWSERGREPHT